MRSAAAPWPTASGWATRGKMEREALSCLRRRASPWYALLLLVKNRRRRQREGPCWGTCLFTWSTIARLVAAGRNAVCKGLADRGRAEGSKDNHSHRSIHRQSSPRSTWTGNRQFQLQPNERNIYMQAENPRPRTRASECVIGMSGRCLAS
jgi:hypothetical protein